MDFATAHACVKRQIAVLRAAGVWLECDVTEDGSSRVILTDARGGQWSFDSFQEAHKFLSGACAFLNHWAPRPTSTQRAN